MRERGKYDFNSMLINLRLFYAMKLGNHIHIYNFCVVVWGVFCTQSYQIWINFKQIYETLTDPTTPGQSEPGSTNNEVVLQTAQT